jgi:hypothetical protein
MSVRKTLAIDLSYECFKPYPQGKPWFDFRSFVRAYWQLLAGYDLLVSYETQRIVLEVAAEIEKLTGMEVRLKTKVLGSSRATRSDIANRAGGEIDRVLCFLDPKRLLDQLQGVPVRMMSERGHKIHVNFGAALWADSEWRLRTAAVQHQSEIRFGEAFVIVEDNAIVPILEFTKEHCGALRLFPQIMTTTNIKIIMEAVLNATATKEAKETDEKRRLTVFRDSPYGELIGIGHQIVRDYYNVPPLRMHPTRSLACHVVALAHYQDEPGIRMQKFLEICADPHLRVNLLLNKQTADEWIHRYEAPKHTFVAGADS